MKNLRPNSYYHVYTHAVGKENCFLDDRDRQAFIEAIRERVVPGLARSRGQTIKTLAGAISIVAIALMGNHLHLVLHQAGDRAAIGTFMQSLLSSYARRFNLRHNRRGPLFMKPYHVRRCSGADDVMNEIAYVHNNPRKPPLIDAWTSHRAYLGTECPDFIAVEHGMRLFGDPDGYAKFFDSYVELKSVREAARRNLPV